EIGLIAFERLGLLADAEDLDGFDLVAPGDLVHDVLAFDDVAEHRMLAIEPWSRDMSDKELAAVAGRTGVGHGQSARAGVFQFGPDFILEPVAGAAGARSQRAAALDHEVGNHPVETQAIVKRLALGLGSAAVLGISL